MSIAPRIVVLECDPQMLRSGEPQKWNATFPGEPLLQRSRDPEHDVCRALLARGITGRVTFVHGKTGTAGLTMDIQKGAGLSVDEATSDGAPRVRKYRPFPTAVSSPVSVSTDEGEPVGEAVE